MQLIMVLHTRGTLPSLGGSSFVEKVNFRPAVPEAAELCVLHFDRKESSIEHHRVN